MNKPLPPRRRLQYRITKYFTVMVTLMIAAITLISSMATERAYLSILGREFDRNAETVHDLTRILDDPGSAKSLDYIAVVSGTHIIVRNRETGAAHTSSNIPDNLTSANLSLIYKYETAEGGRLYAVSNPYYGNTLFYRYQQTRNQYEITLVRSAGEISKALDFISRTLLVIGVLSILVSVAFVYFIARRISRPVSALIAFSERLAEGDYSTRMSVDTPDEIGILQRSLNNLADRIDYQIYTVNLERQKLRDAFENIADAAAFIDQDGYLILANTAFRATFSAATRSRLLYYETIRSTELNAHIRTAYKSRTATSRGMEHEQRHYDADIRPVLYNDSFQGLIITLRDVTEKRRIDSMKTELVGNLSHELKTPITIIKGYLETVKGLPDTNTTRSGFVEKALANVDRLNAIITDMLKLNMIETTADFETERFTLDSLLDMITEILQPKLTARELTLDYNARDAASPVLRGNRFLAEQLFFNLIDNAINYNTPGGSVRISTERTETELAVTVADTGIGIPADSLERVFERFYRVDKARSRSTGGTGLGLSITKHAADLLGWRISVASTEGEGTTFTVRVPLG